MISLLCAAPHTQEKLRFGRGPGTNAEPSGSTSWGLGYHEGPVGRIFSSQSIATVMRPCRVRTRRLPRPDVGAANTAAASAEQSLAYFAEDLSCQVPSRIDRHEANQFAQCQPWWAELCLREL